MNRPPPTYIPTCRRRRRRRGRPAGACRGERGDLEVEVRRSSLCGSRNAEVRVDVAHEARAVEPCLRRVAAPGIGDADQVVGEGDEPRTEHLGACDAPHARALRTEPWRSQAVARRVAAGGGVSGAEHGRVRERENEQDEAEGCGHEGDALGLDPRHKTCRDSLGRNSQPNAARGQVAPAPPGNSRQTETDQPGSAALRRSEPLGVEGLDRVGGAPGERVGVLLGREVREDVVGEAAPVAAARAADADPQPEEFGGCRGAAPPSAVRCGRRSPRRAAPRSRPVSRSLSSCTTRIASGSSLKKLAAALTDRPDSFMYVSGASSATRCSSILTLGESRPLNFSAPGAGVPAARELVDDHEADVVALCRAYLAARDCPSPTTSRSSDEARSPRFPVAGASEATPRLRSRRRRPRRQRRRSPRQPSASAFGLALGGPLTCPPRLPSPSSTTSSRASWTDARTVSSGSSSRAERPRRWSISASRRASPMPSSGDVHLRSCCGTSSGSASMLISFVTWFRTPPSLTPIGSPRSTITTAVWIGWSRRTSCRSMCVIVAAHLVALEVPSGSPSGSTRRRSRRRAPRASPAVPRQRGAQLLLLADRDRHRLRPAVEDARDQPLPAQAPRLSRPEQGPLRNRELDTLSSHSGRL